MAAISISNAVDWVHREAREAEYMSIVAKYGHSDVQLFPQMLAHLVEALERHAEEPVDVLGSIFHELELHNKYKGQFFTPQNVCDMMGMCTMQENTPDIEKKGFISMCEPCCGSGAMVLGFAKAVKASGYDFHRQMVVTAMDVDLKCVHMCYLQLSLYGIPAVVIHGNSLAMQEYSRWYTPVYMLDGWVWRQACGKAEELVTPSYTEAIDTVAGDLRIDNGQIQLDIGNATVVAQEKPRVPKKKAMTATQVSAEQLSLF